MINKRNADTNTCDMCGNVFDTDALVWITSEDFTPKQGENVPKYAYKLYDALCENCYLSILEKVIQGKDKQTRAKNRDKLINALNEMDELVEELDEELKYRKRQAKRYDLLFNFITESTK